VIWLFVASIRSCLRRSRRHCSGQGCTDKTRQPKNDPATGFVAGAPPAIERSALSALAAHQLDVTAVSGRRSITPQPQTTDHCQYVKLSGFSRTQKRHAVASGAMVVTQLPTAICNQNSSVKVYKLSPRPRNANLPRSLAISP